MARDPIYWMLFVGPTVLFVLLVSGEMLNCLREAKKFSEDLNVSEWIWIDGLLVLLFMGVMHSIVPETLTDAAASVSVSGTIECITPIKSNTNKPSIHIHSETFKSSENFFASRKQFNISPETNKTNKTVGPTNSIQ